MQTATARHHGVLRRYFQRYDRPLDAPFSPFRSRDASLLGFTRATAAAADCRVLVAPLGSAVSGLLSCLPKDSPQGTGTGAGVMSVVMRVVVRVMVRGLL